MTKLFFLGCYLTLSCLIRAEEKKPNFVFLLVDDLGWGDFGCYGAEFYETPHIDKLAKDGMTGEYTYDRAGEHFVQKMSYMGPEPDWKVSER